MSLTAVIKRKTIIIYRKNLIHDWLCLPRSAWSAFRLGNAARTMTAKTRRQPTRSLYLSTRSVDCFTTFFNSKGTFRRGSKASKEFMPYLSLSRNQLIERNPLKNGKKRNHFYRLRYRGGMA